LSEEGDDIMLLTISSKGGLIDELPTGVIHKAYSEESLSLKRQVFFFIWCLKFLRKNDFRIIYSSLFQLNVVFGIFKKLGFIYQKLILREANYVSIEWPKSRLYFLFRFIGPMAYRAADAVICLNDDQAIDLSSTLKVNSDRLHVIPNPVISDRLNILSEKEVHFPVGLEYPVFLSVGRLEMQKRIDIVIKAFVDFRQEYGRGSLMILGKGSLEFTLKQLVRDLEGDSVVFFLGEVSNPFPYFKYADLYVLSSDYEGLPNSLIQGCYLTGRVVSTNCRSGPSSILKGFEGGRLVNVNDVSAMREAFAVVLAKPKVYPDNDWLNLYSEASSFIKFKQVIECVE